MSQQPDTVEYITAIVCAWCSTLQIDGDPRPQAETEICITHTICSSCKQRYFHQLDKL